MENLICAINKTLWGMPMLILLMGCGVYLTARLKFFQIFKVRMWMSETFFSIFKKKEGAKRGISPYQAISSALASTIGSGNLIGVATAIASGGAGAVFWMWIAAVFGMATKYAEIFLAVKFRKETFDGYIGGPMYYIEKGLGKGYRWLAVIFSVSGLLACIGMGGMNQANSISAIVSDKMNIPSVAVAFFLMAVSGISVSGGIQRIARLVEKIVPIMAFLYIGVCLYIMISNLRGTFYAFSEIFRAAFAPRAVYGAASGEVLRRAVRFGISRGVFSNEAGLGSSPIVHAAADTKSPEKQGYWGVFEVFVDTIVICTLTAIIIISSGKTDGPGSRLVTEAFSVFLGSFGSVFVGVSAILFCLATILGWSYYGESCMRYLSGERTRAISLYRAVFVLSVGVGSVLGSDFIWEISDMFNGMMMVPNLIAVVLLSDTVIKKTG